MGASGDCQAGDGGTPQIVEGPTLNADLAAFLAPSSPEAIGQPRMAMMIGQDERANLGCAIERRL